MRMKSAHEAHKHTEITRITFLHNCIRYPFILRAINNPFVAQK